jgi:hypothetical protein
LDDRKKIEIKKLTFAFKKNKDREIKTRMGRKIDGSKNKNVINRDKKITL